VRRIGHLRPEQNGNGYRSTSARRRSNRLPTLRRTGVRKSACLRVPPEYPWGLIAVSSSGRTAAWRRAAEHATEETYETLSAQTSYPLDVNYPMAYRGTVRITDQYGDVRVVRRSAASPREGPDEVVRSMMADGRNARLKVGLVQGGSPEMWNLLRPALEKQAGVKK
jgi:hypothetical protein